jgi:hypothetical protein
MIISTTNRKHRAIAVLIIENRLYNLIINPQQSKSLYIFLQLSFAKYVFAKYIFCIYRVNINNKKQIKGKKESQTNKQRNKTKKTKKQIFRQLIPSPFSNIYLSHNN